MKKVFSIIGLISFLSIAFILFTNWQVKKSSGEYLYNEVNKIPKNKVGLLLGTARYLKGGGVNPFFKNRIDAAVRLFHAHKIDFILVSGDNKHESYNEPRELRRALVSRGIPEDHIILDFAGFRTLDSVIRSHLVFGQDSITIISQKFHNERALYIAQKNDIKAVAFNAKDPDKWTKVYWREYLAKTKSYLDNLFHKQPKFLGDPILIE